MQGRGGGSYFILALWTAVALAAPRARAERAGASETGAEEPRFVLEGFGGLATVAASDLNGLIIYDDQVRSHLFDSQLDAMQELGITPSFFSAHTWYWGDRHRDIFMGPERAAVMSPAKWAQDYGLRFSSHLDTPVTPMRP